MEAPRRLPVGTSRVERIVERNDRFLVKNVKKQDRSKPRGGQEEKMTDDFRPSKHNMIDGSPHEQQANMMRSS